MPAPSQAAAAASVVRDTAASASSKSQHSKPPELRTNANMPKHRQSGAGDRGQGQAEKLVPTWP